LQISQKNFAKRSGKSLKKIRKCQGKIYLRSGKHLESCFLYISFIFPSYFIILLHNSRIFSFIFLYISWSFRTWKNSELSLPLHISAYFFIIFPKKLISNFKTKRDMNMFLLPGLWWGSSYSPNISSYPLLFHIGKAEKKIDMPTLTLNIITVVILSLRPYCNLRNTA